MQKIDNNIWFLLVYAKTDIKMLGCNKNAKLFTKIVENRRK
jgi:hypothetical protein